MNLGFTETAVYSTDRRISDDHLTEQLLSIVHNHTNWQYTCEKTAAGYLLKPTFRNMPYRNSFVPEIHVAITEDSNGTFFAMQGRPVRSMRLFLTVWCITLLAFGMVFLLAAEGFPKFIPLSMGAVAYFMCKLSVGITFRSFVKGIEKYF